MHRRVLGAVAFVGGLLLVAAGAVPASAAEPVVVQVSTEEEFAHALTDECLADSVVMVMTTMSPDDGLTVPCDVTLDVNGQLVFLGGTMWLAEGVTLTFRDSLDFGKLEVTADLNEAAIVVPTNAELVVESGTLNASGVSPLGAGIAGEVDDFPKSGTVRVLDGVVTAVGGRWGAGIGGVLKHAGVSLIVEGGTVNATGGASGPGVGPGSASGGLGFSNWPEVTVSGGTLNATGGSAGAGIGSGDVPAFENVSDPDGVRLEVTGGVVTAQGGIGAAGIGGGYNAPGATVIVNGGTVTATGGAGASGIGAGVTDAEAGRTGSGSLAIGAAGTVTATAGAGIPSVGDSAGPSYTGERSVTAVLIDGELYIGSGSIPIGPSGILSIGASGRLLGSELNPSAGSITGTGAVVNYGIIAFPLSNIGPFVGIKRNNFSVSFDLAGGSGVASPLLVFAPALASNSQALPAAPTRAGYVFGGWSVDGSPFTTTTLLPGATGPGGPNAIAGAFDTSPVGPFPVTITAVWVDGIDYVTAALGPECVPGSTVTVPGDITIDSRLSVSCDVTLDVHGNELKTRGLDVAAGVDLAVVDSASGGSLTASSADLTPAIDASDTTSTLSIGATTYIGPGRLLPGDWASVTVTSTGRLLGSEASPSAATIEGSGPIQNNGVIGITPDLIEAGVAILGNNHRVSFETDSATPTPAVTVYATTFSDGVRTLPTPTRGVDRFDGWMLGADPFTTATPLTGTSSDGSPVAATLQAQWTAGSASVGGDLTAASGVAATFTPVLTRGDGSAASTDLAAWQVDAPGVTVTRDSGTGEISVSSLVVGSYPITATYVVDGRSYSDTLTLTVEPGAATSLSLSYTGELKQGSTITVTAKSVDAAGNVIEDVSDEVILASSVASDVIAGNTVTFVHASPHVIMARLDGTQLVGTLRLEVVPAGTQLGATGSNLPVLWLVFGSVLTVAAGLLALLVIRRRIIR